MKPAPNIFAERGRIIGGQMGSDASDGNNGYFMLPCQTTKSVLNCIVSDGMGWEHVSVSVEGQKRTPTWTEMCFIKDIFWSEEEVVIQFHPAKSEYVNCHPFVLHLWKPIGVELPRPLTIMVGPK